MKTFVEESLETADPAGSSHNSLLWDVGLPLGKADMLANLPPRAVVDRLISRYFNSTSPALCETPQYAMSLLLTTCQLSFTDRRLINTIANFG